MFLRETISVTDHARIVPQKPILESRKPRNCVAPAQTTDSTTHRSDVTLPRHRSRTRDVTARAITSHSESHRSPLPGRCHRHAEFKLKLHQTFPQFSHLCRSFRTDPTTALCVHVARSLQRWKIAGRIQLLPIKDQVWQASSPIIFARNSIKWSNGGMANSIADTVLCGQMLPIFA